MISKIGGLYQRQLMYTEWPTTESGPRFEAWLTVVRIPGHSGAVPRIELMAFDSGNAGGTFGYYTPNEHGIGTFVRENKVINVEIRRALGKVQLPEGLRNRLKTALAQVLTREFSIEPDDKWKGESP